MHMHMQVKKERKDRKQKTEWEWKEKEQAKNETMQVYTVSKCRWVHSWKSEETEKEPSSLEKSRNIPSQYSHVHNQVHFHHKQETINYQKIGKRASTLLTT